MPRVVLEDGKGVGCLIVVVVERAVGIDCDALGLVMHLFDLLLQIPDPCLEGLGSFLWRIRIDGDTVGEGIKDPLAQTL